jgi:plasmid stabilization system protein ParE
MTNSPQNARKVKEELEAAIDSLAVFPHRFKVFDPAYH